MAVAANIRLAETVPRGTGSELEKFATWLPHGRITNPRAARWDQCLAGPFLVQGIDSSLMTQAHPTPRLDLIQAECILNLCPKPTLSCE